MSVTGPKLVMKSITSLFMVIFSSSDNGHHSKKKKTHGARNSRASFIEPLRKRAAWQLVLLFDIV
jgi:hypothetical protein